jgi:LysM repeat protein
MASAASAVVPAAAAAAGHRPPSPPQQPPPFILHQVQRSDTIDGLAFRYRVTKGEIRLANDLPSDNIHTCSVLKIPRGALPPLQAVRDPGDTRSMILRRFRVAHGISEAEARFYLDDAGYDEAKAAAVLASDLAFERSHAGAAQAAANGATIVSRVDAASAAAAAARSSAGAGGGGPGGVSRGSSGGGVGLGGAAGRLVTSLFSSSAPSTSAAAAPGAAARRPAAGGSEDADERAALLLSPSSSGREEPAAVMLDRPSGSGSGGVTMSSSGSGSSAAGHLPGTALRHRHKAGNE